MSPLAAVVQRDLRLAVRSLADNLLVVAFFVIAVVLIPLSVGPEPLVLARIAGGVLWVMALLAALLSLDRLFQADYEDGSLDLLILATLPLELQVLGKVLAHWLTTGLPLTVAAPLLGVLMQLPADADPILVATMALGTPILSLIGAIGAALVLGARRGGVLISLLVLPLYTPALIFGALAVDAAAQGLSARPHLLILAALLVAAAGLAPWAAAAALRDAAE